MKALNSIFGLVLLNSLAPQIAFSNDCFDIFMPAECRSTKGCEYDTQKDECVERKGCSKGYSERDGECYPVSCGRHLGKERVYLDRWSTEIGDKCYEGETTIHYTCDAEGKVVERHRKNWLPERCFGDREPLPR
ncbi:hypothetical protein SAMN06296036_110184 [Pseudobacteriovorax antillogorgiicola]|uniref:Uncharacterized protein n=1 Tax=Pseudobacteriovorax antillogorgiicola TaxID=1513793 RepID=A0A1Y6BXW7_9BACT|nr:hypothetical protein EDD56_13724 [Pseudobacteriovorax antillogorgiicola]SMF34954.1 hypothetical protein SAMN06296036_110184 [Pseudobacteriovorax antillogorgiicola]